MPEKIAVIGAGAWGTTISNILAENNYEVSLWVRTEKLANILKANYENAKYLPGVKLNKNIRFYTDKKGCAERASAVFFAVPSQYLRSIAMEFSPFITKKSVIINLAKGIENNTYKRMSEVLEEELHGNIIAVVSGPNYSIEIAKKLPAATVASSNNKECLDYIKKLISTSYFKVFPHDDLIGVEICGAVKNIPAIASGIISQLNYGDNTKASVITLGLTEMNAAGRLFGAKRKTVYGLAGVGDLALTCTGKYSRNQFVGRELAKGKPLNEIKESLHGMVAEGIETTKAMYEFAQKMHIRMPLTAEIYNILYRNKNINNALNDLLRNL